MLLFAISFILVFVSSYFITSMIAPKKGIIGLIYLFLIAFAQIVVTFEVLSLFTAIKEVWIISTNVLWLTVSTYIWIKRDKPTWSLGFENCKNFRNQVNNSLKFDKGLMWLYVGFLTFIISALILCVLMPITNADANGYHVNRSLFWVLQGSLKHFEIQDIRNICLPINSEILYSWVLALAKRDVFLGFFSFVGYLLSIISVYNILSYLGFCTRKKLWVIFILSSLPSVLVQASSTETDIIVAGLITSSIFLFWYALKNDKKIPIFMASLAYALAIGTKTTALIASPAIGIGLLLLCKTFKKYKPLALFVGYGVINFLIFSSYNYILNFIQFHDFLSPQSFMMVSKNFYGIKGLVSNFLKYIFMFFDFTGFKWGFYLTPQILSVKTAVLTFFHVNAIPDGLYTSKDIVSNSTLIEPMMGSGILGFSVFLPCLIWSLIKPVFNRKSKKTRYLLTFATIFIINILVLSSSLAYMLYSVRFVMFFIVLASPVLTYSYFKKKNPLKPIIIFFALFYFVCVSTHLWARPVDKILQMVALGYPVKQIRFIAQCKDYYKDAEFINNTCTLKQKIINTYSKDNRFLIFLNEGSDNYIIKELELKGYKFDFKLMEDANKIDFNKYNLVITLNDKQSATYYKDYPARKNECIFKGKKIIITNHNFAPCYYDKNPNIPSEYPPYRSSCIITKPFTDKHDLNLVAKVGIFIPKNKEQELFFVYENQNNHAKRLAHQLPVPGLVSIKK